MISNEEYKSFDTGLMCLVTIAAHHGISTSVERLAHDYALSDSTLSLVQLASITKQIGLKARISNISLEKLKTMEKVFPILLRLKNGNSIIVAGLGENEDGIPLAMIFDPTANTPGLFAIETSKLVEQWGGDVLLLKRIYSLSDTDQPFGLRWFIPEILKHKKIFRDIATAAVLLHILGIFTPIFFQLVIDKVLVHQGFSTLYVLTIGIVVAIIFESAFGFLRRYLLLSATNKIDIKLVTNTFSHLLSLPVSFFENSEAGVTVRHMQQVEKIRQFLTGRLFLTILDATVLFIYVPILYFYSPLLTFVVLLFTVLIGLVMFFLIGPFRERLKNLYNAEAERQAMLVEVVDGMQTVKTLGIEPVQRKKWDHRAANAVNTHFQVGRISITANAITQMLEKLMMVAIIALGASQVFEQVITVGALIAFNMLSSRVVTPLVQIVSLIHEYQETALSVRMLGNVMRHPPEREKGKHGIRPAFRGGVEFDGVSFQYRPDTSKVIDNISLDIAPGSVVGIVGRSGSGKSTLTKLIQGLYSVHQGVIRLDGIDSREIDLDHLRRNIGVVLQDNFLFRGTVTENIKVTKPHASIDEVIMAARLSGADEFIEKLPQGYDTLLEEKAVNLSGGQKQRLAIARALLPQPRYLIFDEATSALDPESESIVMSNLKKIVQGRTVIIVSHRLSSLVFCNQIHVMDEGRIAASGRHNELMERSELYAHLWRQQNRSS